MIPDFSTIRTKGNGGKPSKFTGKWVQWSMPVIAAMEAEAGES